MANLANPTVFVDLSRRVLPWLAAATAILFAVGACAAGGAMAAAAIGSFSGGKRGVARPGASIMWPLNSATLRGDPWFDSPTARLDRSEAGCASEGRRLAENERL